MMRTIPSLSFFRSYSYICFSYSNISKHIKSPLLHNLILKQNLCSVQNSLQHNPKQVTQQLLYFAINSCSSISYCQIIHAHLVKYGNYSDGFIGDRLASVYAKYGKLSDALKLFEEMPNKDVVSWNSMISVSSRSGDVKESFSLLYRMRSEMGMKPNGVTFISVLPLCADMKALDEGKCIHGHVVKMGFLCAVKVVNSLINFYGKCGYVYAACRLFEDMSSKNLVSWNSMIVVHSHNGYAEEGIDCFNSMRSAGIEPDRATILSILQASSVLAAITVGRSIHGYIVCAGFSSDFPVQTALISSYAKSGNLDSSHEVFLEINNPDRIAWTAMLAGYAMHGYGRKTIEAFNLMVKEGVRPDHVTFTHVLNACSHSGLVEEGRRYFEVMSKVHGVGPRVDHYSCMVDLLGRSGHLEEARKLIESMPIEPNAGVWGALVGACRVHRNVELGKEAAERLFSLDSVDSRNYIILSNMYSAAGQWKEASKVRSLMKERGLRKDPGCSFIEHGNKVHRFVVGDQSHPEREKIYLKLQELTVKMQKAGYVSNTEFVLHDVDEEVKEDMINKHSEKLAIAFGLLVMGANMPIMITKNLRICGDCHSAAKFISLLEQRTIIIRDAKRFHHFANGLCSCGDYW